MKLSHINTSQFERADSIKIPSIFYNRIKTGIKEFDDMFGDGLLAGSSITTTAQAGCGKTTLLLQLGEALTLNGYDVAYAAGEENVFQLAFTCKRLNVKKLQIANQTDVETLAETMKDYDVMIIDSFQSLTTKTKMNSREFEKFAIQTLTSAAKEYECAVFFVLHLTKDGKLKGSTLVPHTVDVNMQITFDPESDDETSRVIDFYKNRFGPTKSYEATLGGSGFQISKPKVSKKASSKKQRKAQLLKEIINSSSNTITKGSIMKEFSLTQSQAYLALKELTDTGSLVKIGRGDNAFWKKS